MGGDRVVVVGAGVGGLCAAVWLAASGCRVTVLERAAGPGGKMREVGDGAVRLDAGPTVFTLRHALDAVFERAGTTLDAHLGLTRAEILARHAWDGSPDRLDLFASVERSADAIGAFAGAAEADGYRRFCADAARVFGALDHPFMRAQRPSPLGFVAALGGRGLWESRSANPFRSLWSGLGGYFRDPRLRQLFGRYATYVGSSPFLAPSTLMLVAHAEQAGVWLVDGGMHRVAVALEAVARAQGAHFRYGADVAEIVVSGGRAAGVLLATGDHIEADAVVFNGDAQALAGGRLGEAARGAVTATGRRRRSLSALTWTGLARATGFPLRRHTVFFSSDYADEFDRIFTRRVLPDRPTVYVCAQDRGADALSTDPGGAERLLILVNAPPDGDTHPFSEAEIDACAQRTWALLHRCGLQLTADMMEVTTPARFDALFPATGGALYGASSHGWRASFRRPGAATRLPGLFLAGGSAHPGAGVPMAALSGRLAAEEVLARRARSTSGFAAPSPATAMPGGMSTG